MDYCEMKILRGKAPRNLSNQSNYFIVDENKMVFNVYKTVATHGVETVSVADNVEFQEAYKLYETILPKKISSAKYTMSGLLQNTDGSSWSRDVIRNRLSKLLGKGVGVGMLRKILATDGAPSKEEMEKLMVAAAGQSHSLNTHIRYYMKNVPTSLNMADTL